MRLILFMTVIGTVLIAAGLLGLYINVTLRLRDIERSVDEVKKKHSRTRQRVRVLEERDAAESDRVVITHEWKEADGIRYPSQEV